jgi:hypothetical protein
MRDVERQAQEQPIRSKRAKRNAPRRHQNSFLLFRSTSSVHRTQVSMALAQYPHLLSFFFRLGSEFFCAL